MKIYRIAETPSEHRKRRLKEDWLPMWREEAHRYFDQLWKNPNYGFSREEAYESLAKVMGVPPEKAHMHRMNPQQCKFVVDWSKQVMRDLQDMDRDFNVNYNK